MGPAVVRTVTAQHAVLKHILQMQKAHVNVTTAVLTVQSAPGTPL